MNLWESTYKRCHPQNKVFALPVPPQWGDAATILRSSEETDIDFNTSIALEEGTSADFDYASFIDEKEYGENYREATLDAIRTSGIEALAFYAPIHFFGENSWGIYFNERTFFGACAEIASLLPDAQWDSIVSDMMRALNHHECFHAAVEFFTLVLEDFANKGHWQLKTVLSQPNTQFPQGYQFPELKCPFELYFYNVYQITCPTEKCLEESLATSSQMRCNFRTKGFKHAMVNLLEMAPPAYRQWNKYKEQGALLLGIQELANRILQETDQSSSMTLKLFRLDQTVWFPEIRVTWLDSKGPIPRRVYHPDKLRPSRFRAPLGNASLKDFLNALERHYAVRVVSGSKHKALVFPNGKKTPFPMRKTVPPYLINQVARALDIERKELLSTCLGIII